MDKPVSALRKLPSVDEVMRSAALAEAVAHYGRSAAVTAVRAVLGEAREQGAASADVTEVARSAMARLEAEAQPNLKPVFNLTGTVLHTNLGRALIAESAIEAATVAMRNAVALEFDLGGGRRGERDELVRDLLCELTGAEDATIVNNNAAAVLLVLNTFAKGREAIVSRGELIEIGGAFRMPEIMSRAGAKLHEIGTTNRTHKKDYVAALSDKTGLILKVHTSNYRIEGFTKEVSPRELAALAHEHSVPLVNDLGSGTLVDLTRFGLKHEPTVAEAVAEGADLVTFSGDKLLGGPQTGFIVGRKALIEKLNKNPMKRALRVDKIRLAMVEATLRLYRDPVSALREVPTLRMLTTPLAQLLERSSIFAARLLDVPEFASVEVREDVAYVGGGSLPDEAVSTAVIALTVKDTSVDTLATRLRTGTPAVVGRIHDGRYLPGSSLFRPRSDCSRDR